VGVRAAPAAPARAPAGLHPNDEARIEACAHILRSSLALESRRDAVLALSVLGFVALGLLGGRETSAAVVRRALSVLGVTDEELGACAESLERGIAGAG
jgi:hypothetical protein